MKHTCLIPTYQYIGGAVWEMIFQNAFLMENIDDVG